MFERIEWHTDTLARLVRKEVVLIEDSGVPFTLDPLRWVDEIARLLGDARLQLLPSDTGVVGLRHEQGSNIVGMRYACTVGLDDCVWLDWPLTLSISKLCHMRADSLYRGIPGSVERLRLLMAHIGKPCIIRATRSFFHDQMNHYAGIIHAD